MQLIRRFLLAALLILFVSVLAWAADPTPNRVTENVILVTTDGLRWQEVFRGADHELMNAEDGGVKDLEALKAAYWRETPEARREALLPFFWDTVARQGQVYGNADKGSIVRVENGMVFSYPGYNEMLAGFPDDERIDSNAKTPNPNRTVLEWLHAKEAYRGRVAAFCSWDVFPFIINTERSGVYVNAGWNPAREAELTEREKLLYRLHNETPAMWPTSRYDAFTFHAAMEYVKKHRPRVLYLSFDETDEFGHEGRYDRYLDSAHRVDAYLRELWETLESIPQYRGRTSILITTDHGRGDPPVEWRSHGKDVNGAEKIWIAILGPDTPALGELTDAPLVTQSQVAATVARLLGEDFRRFSPRSAKAIPTVVGTNSTGRRSP